MSGDSPYLDHGHSPAEPTIKLKARKLFKVYNDEAENLPDT